MPNQTQVIAGDVVKAKGLPKRTVVATPKGLALHHPEAAVVKPTLAQYLEAEGFEVVRNVGTKGVKHTAAAEKARRASRGQRRAEFVAAKVAERAEQPKAAPADVLARMTKAELIALLTGE